MTLIYHILPFLVSAKLINPYCSALEDLFKELSYYGILNVEDAQCYRSDIGLEPTFYILLVAAVVLAIITTFVSRAVTHYFRDKDPHQNPFLREKTMTDVESASDNTGLESISTIHPTPVLFTDRYRWLLRRAQETESNDHEENLPIPIAKSQGSIIKQSTSATIDTPESFSQEESEQRLVDTVAESDEDDIDADEIPASLSSTNDIGGGGENILPSNDAEQSNGLLLGAGATQATIRRGYDVDDDEWILESASENIVDSEKVCATTNQEKENVHVDDRSVGSDQTPRRVLQMN